MAQLLRTAEVSAQTGTPVSTLRWWRHVGEGPPSFSLGKRIVVYSADQLELWIARRQLTSTRGDLAGAATDITSATRSGVMAKALAGTSLSCRTRCFGEAR